MKVVLYAAVSLDGFIARTDDSTPWSDEEWAAFQDFVKSCDVCLMGRKTYEIMKGDGFVEGPKYVVVTNDEGFNSGNFEKISITSADDLPAVSKIGVIGGGSLNGSLAQMGLIDEVVLDVESIAFGAGKTLFGDVEIEISLTPTRCVPLSRKTIQNHYKVDAK